MYFYGLLYVDLDFDSSNITHQIPIHAHFLPPIVKLKATNPKATSTERSAAAAIYPEALQAPLHADLWMCAIKAPMHFK